MIQMYATKVEPRQNNVLELMGMLNFKKIFHDIKLIFQAIFGRLYTLNWGTQLNWVSLMQQVNDKISGWSGETFQWVFNWNWNKNHYL